MGKTYMVEVVRVNRKSDVLTPSSLACLSGIPTMNLTAGCAHACVYCYTQGYRCYPGRGKVVLYANTIELLQRELSRKRRKPQAVYFSPSSDVFQPVPEVLKLGLEVFRLLLEHRIGVAFLTKGCIPQPHLDLFARYPKLVQAQVGISTLDEEISRVFEPHAPAPEQRLKVIRDLVDIGVRVQARLDPILPGITDSSEMFRRLCGHLCERGVHEIAASVLFLRPAIVHGLRASHHQDAVRKLLEQFENASRLRIHGSQTTAIAIPAGQRMEILDRLMEAARKFRLNVRICSCKNPDISSQRCGLGGTWASTKDKQLGLFEQIPHDGGNKNDSGN